MITTHSEYFRIQCGFCPATVVVDGANYSSSTSSFPYAGLINTTGSTGGPKAYLNWLIFDRNFTFLNGGYVRMSTTPKEQGQDVAHELMSSGNITITEPGYVYIYLSNEETSPVEVYFDDFKVTQTNSAVVQVEDYYAFGLSFNEYRRENGQYNSYQYNGKELQDELNLAWMDYGARMYIGEIGRWNGVDKLAELYSSLTPYNYVGNSTMLYRDPNGMDVTVTFVGTSAKEARKILRRVINQMLGGEFELTLTGNGKGGHTLGLRATTDADGKERGDISKLSKGQQEFYRRLNSMTKDGTDTRLNVDYANSNVATGDHGDGTIDMADVEQFPEHNPNKPEQNGPTQGGKVIHELAEQNHRAFRMQRNGNPNLSGIDHRHGCGAEDAVNGNVRWNPDYTPGRRIGHEERFDLTNGTTSRYLIKGGLNSAIQPIITVQPLRSIPTPPHRKNR